jgi:competence CoiA-like predicted nuclease
LGKNDKILNLLNDLLHLQTHKPCCNACNSEIVLFIKVKVRFKCSIITKNMLKHIIKTYYYVNKKLLSWKISFLKAKVHILVFTNIIMFGLTPSSKFAVS